MLYRPHHSGQSGTLGRGCLGWDSTLLVMTLVGITRSCQRYCNPLERLERGLRSRMLGLWWVSTRLRLPWRTLTWISLGSSDERHGVGEPHWGGCIWGVCTCVAYTSEPMYRKHICIGLCAVMHTCTWQSAGRCRYMYRRWRCRCAAVMSSLVANLPSLLRRLIFLTVVYGRTAVRRRKVDGKICFPTLSEIG